MKTVAKAVIIGALATIAAPPAFAQLEEVIVTAQRREESLQDVPISVTALTGQAILEGGFANMEDLSDFVPGLYMVDSFSSQYIQIRGIGTSTGNEAFEQAVAQFHDGVYYGRDNLGQNTLFDLERVEVVKGPQPTFAGQSATAGAINTISRQPGEEFEANAQVSYGSDEETSIEFGVGGPLSDTFGLRLAGRHYELNDPGYFSYANGEPLDYRKNTGVRLTGVWTPADNFSLEFKYEIQDVLQTGTPYRFGRCDLNPATSRAGALGGAGFGALCAIQHLALGIPLELEPGVVGDGGTLDLWDGVEAIDARNGLSPGDPGAWTPVASPLRRGLNRVKEFLDRSDRQHQADIGLVGFDWDIGDLTFSSLTSSLAFDKSDVLDPDRTPFAVFRAGRMEDFSQSSQEIRLTSPETEDFSWMLGAYWQNQQTEIGIPIYIGAFGVGFQGTLIEDSTWRSVFFAGTYNVSDTVRLNFGGRHQDVRKDGLFQTWFSTINDSGTAYNAFVRTNEFGLTPVDDNDTLPELSLEWDATVNSMLYARYAEAFKAGGFVASPAPGGMVQSNLTFLPEFADGIELGLKSRLADDTVELNIALYDTDYSDLQVTVFNEETQTFETTNAAAANTTGIEVDGRWAVADRFTLGFAGQVGKAKYVDYANADACTSLEQKQYALDTGLDPGACRKDLSGNELPLTPNWSLTLTPEWNFDLAANMTGRLSGTVLFSDGYNLWVQSDPLNAIDGFHRVDLRFAVEPANGNWALAVYGRDVTDQKTWYLGGFEGFVHLTSALDYDAGGAVPGRGTRWGVQLEYFLGR